MMKKLQTLFGVAAVLIIVIGIGECKLFAHDVECPPSGAGQLADFSVSAGTTDFYGVYVAKTSFLVNIPQPGTFLLTYYTRSGFGLTGQVLENLRPKGVPENLLVGLRLLVNQKFTTEAEFSDAMARQIGKEETVTYQALISKYAYTKTRGPFFIVVQVKKNSLLHIGLMPGDEVSYATIDEGDATALVVQTPDAQDFGSLMVLFRPEFSGSWLDYFVVNPSFTPIILVQNSVIMMSVEVQELSAAGTKPIMKPKTKAQPQPQPEPKKKTKAKAEPKKKTKKKK